MGADVDEGRLGTNGALLQLHDEYLQFITWYGRLYMCLNLPDKKVKWEKTKRSIVLKIISKESKKREKLIRPEEGVGRAVSGVTLQQVREVRATAEVEGGLETGTEG